MSTLCDKSEITHLIRLLDDRDAFVRDRVRQRLIEIGPEVSPFLEIAGREENIELRREAMQILSLIAPLELDDQFRELSRTRNGEDVNLERGVALLMKFGNSDADAKLLTDRLDQLAAEVSATLKLNYRPTRAVLRLSDFLFREKEFSGNKANYFDPANSFMDSVLETRLGIPITLSVLCLLIGERLSLPLVGVGLPCHFIAKYEDTEDPVFFDPFNRGKILSTEDCAELVQGFGLEFEERFLLPVTHREILIRMIHNLIMVYNRKRDNAKVNQLTGFSKILMKTD